MMAWNKRLVSPQVCGGLRRWGMAAVAVAVLFSAGGAGASETVSNRFGLFVPVTLSVLEVSSAVGIVPAPLIACAVLRLDAVSNAAREVVR